MAKGKLSKDETRRFIELLLAADEPDIELLGRYCWTLLAHESQRPPKGDWTTWLLIGGRGAGKTRAGAEWIRSIATGPDAVSPIALVGETVHEARAVMVEGVSGLLSIHLDHERPHFDVGRARLTWPNGVEALLLPGNDPERFRGPQFAAAWCDELGCGAVDKGPNAPNAFGDPKSSEDKRPPFSSGQPDTLIQRQMLRACHAYWQSGDTQKNPVSPLYGGRMLDPDRLYIWAWDARPFPAFPGMPDVWSDWENHATGHWLNGRLGAASAEEYLRTLAVEYGVEADRIDASLPLIEGLVIEGVISLRDAAAAIADTAGLTVSDGIDGLNWVVPDRRAVLGLDTNALVRAEGPVLTHRRGDAAERPGRLSLGYTDRGRDYQRAAVLAVLPDGVAKLVADSGLVLDPGAARRAAEGALRQARVRDDGIGTALPPSLLALETGDVVTFPEYGSAVYTVNEIRDGAARALSGSVLEGAAVSVAAPPPRISTSTPPPAASEPVFRFAHLPASAGGSEVVCGAFADPWPGEITVRDSGVGADLAVLTGPAVIGFLESDLAAGQTAIWSRERDIDVSLLDGHLASVEPQNTLAGSNRIAIEGADGHWEIVAFAHAALIAPGRYRLSNLLRGQRGTAAGAAVAGAKVMVLGSRTRTFAVPDSALGSTRTVRAYAGTRDAVGTSISIDIGPSPALPLAPVHLTSRRVPESEDIALSWIRRSRAGGDGWNIADVPLDFAPEAYRVIIFDGDTVKRTETVGSARYLYGSADQVADLGATGLPFTFTVQQVSPVLGPGAASTGAFQ